jgi:hypothetical protein
MALLDEANTSKYGNPEITEVNIGVRNNPAILISGHDLRDMEQLLEQTQGTGVDVYTHSVCVDCMRSLSWNIIGKSLKIRLPQMHHRFLGSWTMKKTLCCL